MKVIADDRYNPMQRSAERNFTCLLISPDDIFIRSQPTDGQLRADV